MCELPGRFPRAWGQPTVPTAKPALWDAYRNRSRRRYRLAWVLGCLGAEGGGGGAWIGLFPYSSALSKGPRGWWSIPSAQRKDAQFGLALVLAIWLRSRSPGSSPRPGGAGRAARVLP